MKYKKLMILLVLGVLPVALGIGQACTDSGLPALGTSNSASALDAGSLAMRPVVDCLVKSSTGAVIDHITALSSSTSYSATPPKAPASIVIDCSASHSATGSPIKVAVSDSGGPFIDLPGMTFSQTYPNSGVVPMGIRITDGESVVSTKMFNLPVTCDPATLATKLKATAANLKITAGVGPGYVNVNFAGVASGGKGPYTYAVDLNGDGRMDNYNKTLYTSSTLLNNMYSLYDGSRSVQVNVYDVGCPTVAVDKVSVDFLALLGGAPQSGGVANMAPYYYLQANVSPLSSQSDLADNVQPFNAMEGPVTPDGGPLRHVLCTYNKTSMSGLGTFTIKGLNTYDDGTIPNTDNPMLTQGMVLQLSNIQDAGDVGPYVSAATVSNLTYQSAQAPDGGLNQYVFAKNSACTASITVTRAAAAVPCTTGTGINSPTITPKGTFSCPNARAPASGGFKDVSIDNGYFFCEVAPVNQCVGGGQGQGGGIPPISG